MYQILIVFNLLIFLDISVYFRLVTIFYLDWGGGVGRWWWGKNVFVSQREGVVLSILDFETVETSPLFLA